MSLSEERFMYLLDIAFKNPTDPSVYGAYLDHVPLSGLQRQAIEAAAAVSHVGGRGTAIDGLERIWEKFPGNFTKDGRLTGSGGEMIKGSMTETQWNNKNMLLYAVQSEIDAGISQKKACEKYGISPKSYRDWRDARAKNQAKHQGKSLGK